MVITEIIIHRDGNSIIGKSKVRKKMIFYTVLLILFFQLIGVPVRLEIGPKDKERKQITVVLRHTGARSTIPVENSETKLGEILEQIHSDLYKKYEN